MRITLEDVARFPRPGTAGPAKISWSPDGAWITYLWSPRGDLVRSLWAYEVATGRTFELMSAGGEGPLTREEALRRERQRLRETGITHYAWAEEAQVMIVPIAGSLHVWRDGKTEKIADGVSDARISRDGRVIAWVRDGWLYANGRRLVRGGTAEFIAQEEMHRHDGFWISPDGQWIAFEQFDDSHIPVYPIVHQGKDTVEVEEHRYPFSGGPNVKWKLGVISVNGGEVRWVDTGDFEYLARVKWSPDNRLYVQVQTRDQKRVELRCDGRTVAVRECRTWVNLRDDLQFADGGFVWGDERADSVLRDGYWTSGYENPTERHVYRGRRRLTSEPGFHDAVPRGDRWVHIFSSLRQPPRVTLDDRVVYEPPRVDLEPPELHSFRTRDGETLYAALYRGRRGAPLIVSVYGGPGHQAVQNDWLLTVDMRAQYLRQLGYNVLKVDNRGSSRRGHAFEEKIYRNLGDLEVRDQVDGVRWAAPLVGSDPTRVGIYGWSYGGYLTLMALCRAPEVFVAGVAGAPVTSWDGYDTHYTERYMGTPEDNPEGYRSSSVMTHVENLRGRLLLIHGMLDENVHFRHTARLVDALHKANKPHELLLYPNERHMPRSEKDRLSMETRIVEFFRRTLPV